MVCEKKENYDCYDIGTRLCNDNNHDAYIEEVSGVSIHLVKALREDQTESFLDFFEQIKKDTWSIFKKDVESGFTKEKKFNHVVAKTEPYSVGHAKKIFKVEGIEGYKLSMPYHEFLELKIIEIGVFAHTAGDAEFLVADLSCGDIVYRKEIKIKTGKQKIAIGVTLENDFNADFFIGIKSKDAVFYDMECRDFKPCCECLCKTECEIARIQDCEGKQVENIEWIANKAFCLKAEIGCNFDKILCEYSEYFLEARKYCIAIKILEQKINSYERGWFSDANVELVKETTLPELKERYYELIGLGITNIREVMDDSICWQCDPISGMHPMIATI
jgi:hypothetical protein